VIHIRCPQLQNNYPRIRTTMCSVRGCTAVTKVKRRYASGSTSGITSQMSVSGTRRLQPVRRSRTR
jgi:hypothetical protein